jgi:SAM-dependent methyltransferase
MPSYDAAFFEYVNSGAVRSAQRLLPLLTRELRIGSVLDVGCGQGAWLSVWQKLGVAGIGIDGAYVDTSRLLIPASCFLPRDLQQPFTLDRRFDVVQSLEVAEHLPAAHAADFIASLVRHGDLILFSAAPKGQGGDHHVNEQEYDYWRKLFAQHGYLALDYVRPLLHDEPSVEPWYRYNTLLYASSERLQTLPEAMRRTVIPVDQRIRDVSPPAYRVRKALIAALPVAVVTGIAKLKERVVAARRGAANRAS